MSDLLQERYGTGHPRRRLFVIVATTLLAVAFISWLAWAAWFHSSPAIEARVNSFEVMDAHQVRVKVDAEIRDEEVRGSCLLRATASDHTIVGELNLSAADLRASEGEWIAIRTERKATTVELVRCRETDGS